jgi:arsenate reductase (glutaredoxin)
LTERGMDFESINYLENPLSEKELKKLLHDARLKPIDAIRTNEAEYRQQVAGKDLSEEQLIRVMVKYPELIQRPIVARGNQAVLARPADKLKELGIK